MFDTLIQNVRVMDPETGLDAIRNVGITGNKIASISESDLEPANTILDGSNLILAPGFIDIHAHEDYIASEELYSDLPFETASAALKEGVTTIITGNCGTSPWPIGKYLQSAKQSGIVINTSTLVGNITLRVAVGLTDRYAPASKEQIDKMKILAEQAFMEGAAGISFGLEYALGTSIDEELALAAVAAKYGKIMAVHMRYDFPSKALEGLKEVLYVAEETGVSLEISHLAANVYSGDLIAQAQQLIARSSADVSCDMYPYDAWATSLQSSVFDYGFDNFTFTVEDLELLTGPHAGEYCTQEMFDYIRSGATEDVFVACHNAVPPDDLDAVYRLPYAMMGSDAELMKTVDGHYMGHPRSSSAAVRFLTVFVKERKVLDLMTALGKMTILPAKKLGLASKGRLQVGMDADMVLFSLDELKENARFGVDVCADCPSGIHAVFVGGNRVL